MAKDLAASQAQSNCFTMSVILDELPIDELRLEQLVLSEFRQFDCSVKQIPCCCCTGDCAIDLAKNAKEMSMVFIIFLNLNDVLSPIVCARVTKHLSNVTL